MACSFCFEVIFGVIIVVIIKYLSLCVWKILQWVYIVILQHRNKKETKRRVAVEQDEEQGKALMKYKKIGNQGNRKVSLD